MRRAITIVVATTTLFSVSPSVPTAYAENMPLPAPSLSPFEKRAARLARESAITQAAIEFENARNELGPMPAEPQRVAKSPSKNKVKSR